MQFRKLFESKKSLGNLWERLKSREIDISDNSLVAPIEALNIFKEEFYPSVLFCSGYLFKHARLVDWSECSEDCPLYDKYCSNNIFVCEEKHNTTWSLLDAWTKGNKDNFDDAVAVLLKAIREKL